MAGEDRIKSQDMNSKEGPKATEPIVSDDYVIVPPDGGWAWIVTAACFLCVLISDGILFSFGLILSKLEHVFDQPAAKVAWVFSIVNGISLISGPFVSALSNQLGFRTVIIIGSVTGFIGLSTSVLAQSVDTLFFTLGIFFGLAVGLVFNPVVIGVGFYFDKKRALATGIAVCGSGAGTFVFAPLTHWLLETYALRGTFLIMSGLYLNCAVFGSLLIPLKPQRRSPENIALLEKNAVLTIDDIELKEKRVQPDKEQDDIKVIGKKQSKLAQLSAIFKFQLFRSPSFIIICASSFFQSIGWFIPFMYLAAHAVNVGISKESASFLISVVGLCSMLGRLVNGLLADHPKVSVLLLNNISLTLSGLLMIACPFLISYELLLVLSILLGLGLSCTAVTRPILLGELLGLENVNNAYGFMLVFYGIATLFGTPLAGLLYDTFGDYHGSFYLAGSSVLLSAFICYPLGRINGWEKRRTSKK